MKIIENKVQKHEERSWPRMVQCDNCKSKLEIDPEDISGGFSGDDGLPYRRIVCPCCKLKTSFSEYQ